MQKQDKNFLKVALSNPFSWWLLITIFYLLYFQLRQGFAKESWQITEWLINYQGGFVRRGLPGEILFQISQYFGITPYYIIVVFSLILYAILAGFFIISFRRKGYPLSILLFFFFLGGPAINNFIVRKDILEMLLFISAIYFLLKDSLVGLVISNLSVMIALLTHEAIGFICLPVMFLLLLQDSKLKSRQSFSFKRIFFAVLKLLPALLTFAAMMYYKGSMKIAMLIWDSWSAIPFPYHAENGYGLPASIGGLTWSIRTALELTRNTLLNFSDGIYAPLAWLLIISVIFFVLHRFTSSYKKGDDTSHTAASPAFSRILVLQLLAVAPLFILGWDYGRWIFFWVTSSFALLVLVPGERISNLLPFFISRRVDMIDARLGKYDSMSIKKALPFFIGVQAHSWSLMSYFLAIPAVQMLRLISMFIHYCIQEIRVMF